MKSVSGVKPNKFESPKTPGGISKSLLTPCRRLGLSRNWKKSGNSPFQSPLSSSQAIQDDVVNKKRKESDEINTEEENSSKEAQTPTRVALPRRKKSKTLLAAINKSLDCTEPSKPEEIENISQEIGTKNIVEDNVNDNIEEVKPEVSTVPLKTKSRSKKKISPTKSVTNPIDIKENVCTNINTSINETNKEIDKIEVEPQRKSPNNLTNECIVVIQKKIFKKELKNKKVTAETKSHALFDSDSDDVPLIQLNAPKVAEKNDEDDFTTKPKIVKLEKSSKTKLRSPKVSKHTSKVIPVINEPPISQDSDNDDFVDRKRTIVIKKTYNKVIKPQKAKSTGSITQKDIDDIKARIETKKKMLLAKTMTEDTKELKDLIKKWQKGCQDALLELMDLMKNKCPEKQNMEYSEILETLKIPASLVGYDSENDCFLTPNDEDVILGRLKD